MSCQDKFYARHASWIAYLQQFTFVIKHQSGKLNKVGDALSRRHGLLATLHVLVPGCHTLTELYPTDPIFARPWEHAQLGSFEDYQLLMTFV